MNLGWCSLNPRQHSTFRQCRILQPAYREESFSCTPRSRHKRNRGLRLRSAWAILKESGERGWDYSFLVERLGNPDPSRNPTFDRHHRQRFQADNPGKRSSGCIGKLAPARYNYSSNFASWDRNNRPPRRGEHSRYRYNTRSYHQRDSLLAREEAARLFISRCE